jgi:pantothenate kinase type III
VLLVDIGNTRIKWSVLRGEKLGRQKALEHAGLTARDLERQLFATRGITRVVAASVASGRLNR